MAKRKLIQTQLPPPYQPNTHVRKPRWQLLQIPVELRFRIYCHVFSNVIIHICKMPRRFHREDVAWPHSHPSCLPDYHSKWGTPGRRQDYFFSLYSSEQSEEMVNRRHPSTGLLNTCKYLRSEILLFMTRNPPIISIDLFHFPKIVNLPTAWKNMIFEAKVLHLLITCEEPKLIKYIWEVQQMYVKHRIPSAFGHNNEEKLARELLDHESASFVKENYDAAFDLICSSFPSLREVHMLIKFEEWKSKWKVNCQTLRIATAKAVPFRLPNQAQLDLITMKDYTPGILKLRKLNLDNFTIATNKSIKQMSKRHRDLAARVLGFHRFMLFGKKAGPIKPVRTAFGCMAPVKLPPKVLKRNHPNDIAEDTRREFYTLARAIDLTLISLLGREAAARETNRTVQAGL